MYDTESAEVCRAFSEQFDDFRTLLCIREIGFLIVLEAKMTHRVLNTYAIEGCFKTRKIDFFIVANEYTLETKVLIIEI